MPQTAIVTGGAGFIGSHLVDALVADGSRVVVVDDLSSGREGNVPQRAELERVDVSAGEELVSLVERVAPDAIYHLAAQASVTASVEDPARDCVVNVLGTLNVVRAAGRVGAPVVFTSTGGALYGDDAPLPTPERFTPAPLSPYGASKWAAEAYVRTWSLADGIPHAVCRLGNVYGPRQSPHGEAGVVAIFSHRLWSGSRPVMYGEGSPTRDYVHVSDVVAALRAASGHAGVFNVATGSESSVTELLEILQAAAGTSVEPELAPLRPGELRRSCLETSHTAASLGVRAQVQLSDGLRATYHALAAEFAAGSEQASALA